jgi:hypothetical protein
MATTVIDGYTITATASRGAIYYVVTRPDGSELFDASSSAGLFNGFSSLRRKAEEDGEGRLAYKLTNVQTQLLTAGPALDQQAIKEVTPPPASAGAVAANNQTARTDGATAQNPTSLVTEPLGSVEEPIVVDEGLDPDPIKLSISQATPAPDINAGRINVAALVEGGLSPQEALTIAAGGTASSATQPGVGDGRADGPIVTGNSTKDIIKSTFGTATNSRIITQPNVLDEYASYTYQISWYLLSTDQYNQLMAGPTAKLAGWTLLMQSGGAPKTTDNNATGSSSPGGRSAKFPDDYYIDDLEIVTSLPGGGTEMAHAATQIKFKVTEPNGITLVQNLYRANQQLNGVLVDSTVPDYASQDNKANQTNTASPNYIKAQYCLVVRFYGYDSQGNLSAPLVGRYNRKGTGQATSTDPRAVVEKIFPFLISELKFRTTKSLVEYYITAQPVGLQIAIGQARGTIPFNFQLSGTTVKDVLNGNAPQTLSALPGERTPQANPPSDSDIPPGPPNPRSTSATFDALGNYTDPGTSPFQGVA